MPIKFKIYLTDDSKSKIKNLVRVPENLRRDFRQAGYLIGKELTAWLKKDMKNPKSGKIYKSYFGVSGKLKKPKLARASSSNETPAIRTGAFRKSINFIAGNNRVEFGSGDGSAEKYAKILELGSKKMSARKPLQKTAEANEGKIREISSNVLKKLNDFYNK